MSGTWTVFVTTMTTVFVTYVTASTITRYHQSPLPMCGEDTVCSEISELPSLSSERNFFTWMSCTCPSGLTCPKHPGRQTIAKSDNEWFGMCKPVSDIPTCMIGQLAQEVFVGARQLGMRSFRKIHCMCPSEGGPFEDGSAPNMEARERMDDQRADSVYELICGDESSPSKRGSRFRGGKFRKFYFY